MLEEEQNLISNIDPNSPDSLAEQVASIIRDRIIQNAYAPGERIRERALAEELSVSRTPMREALKVLSAEGLVALLPNRGAVVSNPSAKEVYDMLKVISSLEALAGELACETATDTELDELKALHFEMLAAYSRKDRLEYFKSNQKIHLFIARISRNESLQEMHNLLNARLYRVRYQSNLRNEGWSSAISEHEEILESITQRDSARTATLMRSHLGSTWAKVNKDMEAMTAQNVA